MAGRILALAAAFAMAAPATVDGQDSFAVLDSVVRAEMVRGEIPGAAVAVVHGAEVVFSRTYGVTVVDSDEPIRPETLFRVGSITKTVTAVAILSLVESGSVTLDSPIREYLPDLPPQLGSLTLEQLLSHTSGMRDGSVRNDLVDPDALDRFCSSLTDEGWFHGLEDVWSYTNAGYALAGCTAAAAAGVTYQELVQTRVLDPLGMTQSTFDPLTAMARPLAKGHANGRRLDRFATYANIAPAGSLFSTVSDMISFAEALANGGRLDGRQALPESVVSQISQTWVPATDIGWGPMQYGYGMFSFTWAGRSFLMHGGLTGGFGADLLLSPNDRFAVVVLANRRAAYLDGTKRMAARTVLDLDDARPAEIEGFGGMKDLTAWEGEYGFGSATYAIIESDGCLWLRVGNQELALEKVDRDVLRISEPSVHLPFPSSDAPRTNYCSIIALRDDSGRIEAIQYGLRVYPRWPAGG